MMRIGGPLWLIFEPNRLAKLGAESTAGSWCDAVRMERNQLRNAAAAVGEDLRVGLPAELEVAGEHLLEVERGLPAIRTLPDDRREWVLERELARAVALSLKTPSGSVAMVFAISRTARYTPRPRDERTTDRGDREPAEEEGVANVEDIGAALFRRRHKKSMPPDS
jgi:hypothetical protein